MKVSDLIVRCLENEGVKYVFGVPGEENEDLLFSLEKSSIRFIPTRHEQGAAFMANVWGRLTGKAGVCLSTLGPGATNLVTGVADAYLDKSPLVAITGQAEMHHHHRESHQTLDIVNMFKPITKWNASISSPEVVPQLIRKAFKIAEQEKPGATQLELPEDIAGENSDAEPMAVKEVKRAAPDRKAVQEAVNHLKNAKKPLILAGNGAIRKNASAELRIFTDRFRIPVAHTFMGQGAVSDFSDVSLLTIGLPFRDIVMDAVEEADLILTVGYDIAEYLPSCWNPGKNKKILHFDFAPAEVYSHYQPAVEVVGDISESLRLLRNGLEETAIQYDPVWFTPIRKRIWDEIRSYDLKEGQAFTIPGTLNLLRQVMKEGDLLISDVGTHKIWVARNFPVACANGCLISNGLASMGIALPGAIAAALQDPDRGIVAVMGDGGFLMNSQELETAKRLGVKFTAIVFNDNDYGQISWKQKMTHRRSTGTRISNPDFKKYAESFGIAGYKPETVAELRQILEDVTGRKELCVIEVPVNQKVTEELARKFGSKAPKEVLYDH